MKCLKLRYHYTEFQNKIYDEDDINKGEEDEDDLSRFTDDTIWKKLKDRIYDSSVTVIFISPNMRELDKEDRDQWIPWEISYSLKETSRKTKTGKSVASKSNAMLAVVLPDSNGSYKYYLESKTCCFSFCTMHHTEKLFNIFRKNKFNLKNPITKKCKNNENVIWTSLNSSYIDAVKWEEFIYDYRKYIDMAIERQNNIDDYNIQKEL